MARRPLREELFLRLPLGGAGITYVPTIMHKAEVYHTSANMFTIPQYLKFLLVYVKKMKIIETIKTLNPVFFNKKNPKIFEIGWTNTKKPFFHVFHNI